MRMKKCMLIFLVVIIICSFKIFSIFVDLSAKYADYKNTIPHRFIEAVETDYIQKHLYYSPVLIPWKYSIDRYYYNGIDYEVEYTVYFLPFGSIGMKYSGNDGYSQEKKIAGWL